MIVRPVRDSKDDAEAVRTVAASALGGPWPPERSIRHTARTRHLARTDPGGCWLAHADDGRPLGTVLSSRREGTWGLSLLAVAPEAQGKGAGRALLARALAYGKGCLRGIICASADPRAARAYRAAGFALHPAMSLAGEVDVSGLDAPDGAVAEAGPKQRDLMDSVDRLRRGGAHGPDHDELVRHFACLVCDDLAGSGYVYVGEDGTIELLAATSRRIATRLLTASLLSLGQGARAHVGGLTAEQQWALDVGLAARLDLEADGFVALRGMRPPEPYVPSRAYL
ncbi:GNAT family N-acetyltransferase [Streptomyces boninensis]|uniref:GNAT family N-acetyltransferase n=1 Tax=Streptomyces boninensis TaxID=2039455 RepID=UPI003B222E7A